MKRAVVTVLSAAIGVLLQSGAYHAQGLGVIVTVIGDSTDGSLRLLGNSGVAVDGAGNVYFAERAENRVRKLDVNGALTTFAGTGTAGYSGDGGPAGDAELRQPHGLAIDAAGNVFVADSFNHVVRRVDAATGVITTVAGHDCDSLDAAAGCLVGEGGPATAASLMLPNSVAVDAAGNLYISDSACEGASDSELCARSVRKVDAASGVISTVAGSGCLLQDGSDCAAGDGGPATLAGLGHPSWLALSGSGILYISDPINARIRALNASGSEDTVVAVAVAPLEPPAGN